MIGNPKVVRSKKKEDKTLKCFILFLGNRGGSNPRPSESQSDALTN